MVSLKEIQKEVEAIKNENTNLKKRIRILENKENNPAQQKEKSVQQVATQTPATVNVLKTKKPKEGIKQKKVEPKKGSGDFETDVGLKWFSIIGILALVIGVGFFVKYAIDNNWINHLTRIILGVLFGIALIIIGELTTKKEKYERIAKTLIGGGLAIVYFVIFSAYAFEQYRIAIGITPTLEIILLTIIVIIAVFFSIRDDSQTIGGIAFFLGYATALMSNSYEIVTLMYIILLTIGLVAVVSYKKWAIIGIGGVIATYIVFVWQIDEKYNFFLTALFLIAVFIAYYIQSQFLIARKEFSGQYIAISVINTIFFYLLFITNLNAKNTDITGGFTLLLGLLFLGGYYLYNQRKEHVPATFHIYIALMFLTLSIPIQLNKEWITIIWAFEVVILTLLSLRLKITALRISSYFVGAVTFTKTLFIDSFLTEFTLKDTLLSARLFSYAATILAFYLIYYYFRSNEKEIPKGEIIIFKIYSWLAMILIFFLIILELIDNHMWISIVLAILSIVLMLFMKTNEFRYQSMVISGMLFIKILFIDSWNLEPFDSGGILKSTRLIVFITAILAFYIINYLWEKKKEETPKGEYVVSILYSYFASFLAMLILLIELKEFWISIGWCVLALILMITGFNLKRKHFRIQGIIIIGLTIIKVFLYDTRELSTAYRTISFIVLGIILLSISFIYAKYKDKIKEIL